MLRTWVVLCLITSLAVLPASAFGKDKHYYRVNNRNSSAIKGSGELATQTRTTDPFQRIQTNLAIEMKIEVGKAQSISITFDDNLIDFIHTESDGKLLVIDTDESFSSHNSVEITITVPQLEMVESEGSGTIDIVNIDSKRFRATISGSGELTATGKVEQLEIEINGSGDVQADELLANEVFVEINGSGSAAVNAVESLDGEINGSGDIVYIGKPDSVHSSVNGSGSIRKRK
jgi:hypothetical protein